MIPDLYSSRVAGLLSLGVAGTVSAVSRRNATSRHTTTAVLCCEYLQGWG